MTDTSHLIINHSKRNAVRLLRPLLCYVSIHIVPPPHNQRTIRSARRQYS